MRLTLLGGGNKVRFDTTESIFREETIELCP